MSLALHLGAIPDADDVQLFRPAGRHSGDSIEDQRARQPMKPSLRVVLALHQEFIVFLYQRNPFGDQRADLTLRTFDQHSVAVHRVLHVGGHGESASYLYETFQILMACESCQSLESSNIPLQPHLQFL